MMGFGDKRAKFDIDCGVNNTECARYLVGTQGSNNYKSRRSRKATKKPDDTWQGDPSNDVAYAGLGLVWSPLLNARVSFFSLLMLISQLIFFF